MAHHWCVILRLEMALSVEDLVVLLSLFVLIFSRLPVLEAEVGDALIYWMRKGQWIETND